MLNKEIISKIREKREFSQLPEIDIELAYQQFEKREATEEEKIKLTKELLRKLFSAFVSKKLLSLKDKKPEWILRKHISTEERLPYYLEIYKRIFAGLKKASVIDLGAGINGFSFPFFKENRLKIEYIAIESVNQLNELVNFYFKKNKIAGEAIHLSLLDKENVLKLIKGMEKPKIVFMFKVIDALEDLKRDYSKELILDIIPLVDKMVVSFATKSLGNRQSFGARRSWILNFIKDNFEMLDEFEIGGERYVVFKKKL